MKKILALFLLAAFPAYAGLSDITRYKSFSSGSLLTAAELNALQDHFVDAHNLVVDYFPGDSLKVKIHLADTLISYTISKIVVKDPLVSLNASDSLLYHIAHVYRANLDSIYIGGTPIVGFVGGATAGKRVFWSYARMDTVNINDSLTVRPGAKVVFVAGSAVAIAGIDADSINADSLTLSADSKTTALAGSNINFKAGTTFAASRVNGDTINVDSLTMSADAKVRALAGANLAFLAGSTFATTRVNGDTVNADSVTLSASSKTTALPGATITWQPGARETAAYIDVDTLAGTVLSTGRATFAAGLTSTISSTFSAGLTASNGIHVDGTTNLDGPVTSALAPNFSGGLTASSIKVTGTTNLDGPVTSALAPNFTGGLTASTLKVTGTTTATGRLTASAGLTSTIASTFTTGITAATVRIGGATRDSALTGTGGHFTGGLKVDGASTLVGKVGIGSYDANYNLNIQAAGATAQLYNSTNSGNTDFYLSGNNASSAAKYFTVRMTANDATNGAMYFIPNSATTSASALSILSGGPVLVGTSTASAFAAGPSLLVAQGANYDNSITLQQNDVAHGMTTKGETTTYGFIKPGYSTSGGLLIVGMGDAGATGGGSLSLTAYSTAAAPTTKNTGTYGLIALSASVANGTGVQAVATNGALVSLDNNSTTAWILDAEGDTWQTGGATLGGDLVPSADNGPNIGSVAATWDTVFTRAITGGGTAFVDVKTTNSQADYTAITAYFTNGGSSSVATGPSGVTIRFPNAQNDNNTQRFIDCTDGSGSKMIVYSDGDVVNHDGTFAAISDSTLKTFIVPAPDVTDLLKQINVREFEWKTEPGEKHIGVMAQEVEKIFPHLVLNQRNSTTIQVPEQIEVDSVVVIEPERQEIEKVEAVVDMADVESGARMDTTYKTIPAVTETLKVPRTVMREQIVLTDTTKAVDMTGFIWPLVQGYQRLAARDDSLQARIEALESQNAFLNSTLTEVLTRLDKLEGK